jgi:hypothetical protein
MDDAAPGGHPLHVPRTYDAFIPEAVAMGNGSTENIGDRLDAAVRMPGEAFAVKPGIVASKVIEQKKGIEWFGLAEPECPLEMNAGSFERRLASGDLSDGPDSHRFVSLLTKEILDIQELSSAQSAAPCALRQGMLADSGKVVPL